jgi:DNA-binding response OmpR family regulator
VSRILIHEPRQDHEEWTTQLAGKGRDVVVCADRESLVRALADRRPDVLVYVLGDRDEDLSLLASLRQVAPMLPIIVLDGPADLTARRSIQELKPTYYGVFPLEASELNDAIRGALHRTATH